MTVAVIQPLKDCEYLFCGEGDHRAGPIPTLEVEAILTGYSPLSAAKKPRFFVY